MCTGTSNHFNVAIIPFFFNTVDTVDIVFVCFRFFLYYCVIFQVVIMRAGAARQ